MAQVLDIAAARSAGYSDQEISDFVAQSGGAIQPSHVTRVPLSYQEDPSTPEWQAKYGPLSGMSLGARALAGTGRGLYHTGASIGNLVGAVPDEAMRERQQLDAPLLADPAGGMGNLAGEAIATAPAAAGVGGLAARALPALSGPIAQGAIQGGVQGLATGEPGERSLNTLVGALTGGTAGAGSRLANAATYGFRRTPEAQYLIDRGVDITPGQMNPSSAWNQVEAGAEHIPIVSQMTEAAREGGEQGWQHSVFSEAAAPGATITRSPDMHGMLQQAYDSYAPLYDQARGVPLHAAIMNGPQGIKLSAAFSQIAQLPGTTDAAQKAAGSYLQNELTRLPTSGRVLSDNLLELRSNIRQELRQARLSTDTVAQDKAKIFSAADAAVTRALKTQLPPDKYAALETADRAYGNYKVVENAVAASKDQPAGLTPQKLSQAVYNATPDQSYALGAGGQLRNLASAGVSVFRQKVPPTGASVLTMGTAGGLAAMHPYVAAPVLGAGALTTLTPTGRALAQGVTGPQRAAQGAVSKLSGALGAVPGPRIAGPSPTGQVARGMVTQAGMPYVQQYAPSALAAALMLGREQPQQPSR